MTNEELAIRHGMDALKKADFITFQERDPVPVMFVYIKPGPLPPPDGRDAGTPLNPRPPEKVLERVQKWWQVQKYLQEWQANPQQSPGVLVAVQGTPSERFVIAALMIERSKWKDCKDDGGICVPTVPSQDLDAFKLRGRGIQKQAGIVFELDNTRHFAFLNVDFTLSGGQYTRL